LRVREKIELSLCDWNTAH